jgi:proprotein convertase subtilisin/kexin type 5
MPNCLHCSSNSTCTRCVSGYAVSVTQDCIICANGDPRCISCDGSGNCIGCEYGYGLNPSGLCIACNTNIPNCNDCNTAQSCTQCATGNFLYQPQLNIYHCKSCSPTYSNCLQCNPSVCTKCQPTFALSTSQACSSCSGFIGNCTDCTDRFTCTQCFVGFAVTNVNQCA